MPEKEEKPSMQNLLRELLLKALRKPMSHDDALYFAVTINLIDLVVREIGEERIGALWHEAVLGFKRDMEQHMTSRIFSPRRGAEVKHTH